MTTGKGGSSVGAGGLKPPYQLEPPLPQELHGKKKTGVALRMNERMV